MWHGSRNHSWHSCLSIYYWVDFCLYFLNRKGESNFRVFHARKAFLSPHHSRIVTRLTNKTKQNKKKVHRVPFNDWYHGWCLGFHVMVVSYSLLPALGGSSTCSRKNDSLIQLILLHLSLWWRKMGLANKPIYFAFIYCFWLESKWN